MQKPPNQYNRLWFLPITRPHPTSTPPPDLTYWNIAMITLLLWLKMLQNPSSLCLLHDRPINWRWGVEARNTTLFGKLADWEDGKLVSLKNHLIGVWMPVSFTDSERERRWRSKVKRAISLANIPWNGQPPWGDVLVSSFLQPFTGGQGQTVSLWAEQQRGRVPWGRPLCMIRITKATKSKVKVKETDPMWSPI